MSLISKVMNNTGRRVSVSFWGVMESPGRSDHSEYYDISVTSPFGAARSKTLNPGLNTIVFSQKVPRTAASGIYQFYIFGKQDGLSVMPALEGSFCKDVSLDQCIQQGTSPANSITIE